MKNPKVWHFYALFHKEQKNYAQAVKCYIFASKYDQENLNLKKDLANLLLYLGNFDDYAKYSLECIDIKSSLSINWVQYAVAEYFLKNYEKSLLLIDSVLKSFEDFKFKEENKIFKLNENKKEKIIFNKIDINNFRIKDKTPEEKSKKKIRKLTIEKPKITINEALNDISSMNGGHTNNFTSKYLIEASKSNNNAFNGINRKQYTTNIIVTNE